MNFMQILNLNKDHFNFQLHQKSYIEKLRQHLTSFLFCNNKLGSQPIVANLAVWFCF